MFIGAVLLDFREPGQNVETLVRRTLAEIDPNLTVSDFGSFDAQVAGNFNNERIIARLTCLFGILALVLASVGLYGVMSYFVARRTSEIGVRMALGSTRSGVLLMVLRGAFWQVLIGLGVGVPAALLAGHLMASQLYGVGSYDLGALFGAIAVRSALQRQASSRPGERHRLNRCRLCVLNRNADKAAPAFAVFEGWARYRRHQEIFRTVNSALCGSSTATGPNSL
jgi:macrolide transport system ATP-binding/permease protein